MPRDGEQKALYSRIAVPWRCHRSLIADALTVRGIQVDNIMSMKRFQVHSLITFAHVPGHRITYSDRNKNQAIEFQCLLNALMDK
jgi:uncharacterized protein (DUF488 family)